MQMMQVGQVFSAIATHYMDRRAEWDWDAVVLSKMFREAAEVLVESNHGTKVPPWATLRTWAHDAFKARRGDRPAVDFNKRWTYAQTKGRGHRWKVLGHLP
jgi:hypothetical protein